MELIKVLKEVLVDYNNDLFYREDDLKNSLYYHMRSKIDDSDKQYIYTEFKIGGKKADIVITNEKINNKTENIKDSITAIFELKYTKNFSKAITGDLEKLKSYSNEGYSKNFIMIYEGDKKKIQDFISKNKYLLEKFINIYFIIWDKKTEDYGKLYQVKNNDKLEEIKK